MISHIMTLANSIIGVSVLAMPYCFKQCGIILATLLLLLSSILSRLACYFLIKSAVMSRRRNYEFLAFHAFGNMGKFLVELFMIGFLLGTCVAFFVVMGDLGPEIIGKAVDKQPENIRTSLLITSAAFVVLPLGLFRNIDSLSSICTATIAFYICLVLKIISESTRHILAEDWYKHVYYWRPAGILQCLPIFSMALFCQTQLFEIYDTLPNASLDKMNAVVKGALNICTSVYLCVGFFGYIAFCTQPFTGNILMSLESSLTSEIIKMGFVISIAFSFPLVIFPCRASLNSLLFRRISTHEPLNNYIPEPRFRYLTFTIVVISLIIGILIPNIEFVLGLVGSTIGVMICLIFPAAFFISINTKSTNERLLAQFILLVGIWILTLGTYANLYAMEESSNVKILAISNKFSNQINNIPLNVDNNLPMLEDSKGKLYQSEKLVKLPKEKIIAPDIRQEPPIPIERIVDRTKIEKVKEAIVVNIGTLLPIAKNVDKNNKAIDLMTQEKNAKLDQEDLKEQNKVFPTNLELSKKDNNNNNLINSDAIKKEETELAAEVDLKKLEDMKRLEELRKTLEKHKMEQMEIIQEQKEILKDIREQKQELEKVQIERLLEKNKKYEDNMETVKVEKLLPNTLKQPDKEEKEHLLFQVEKNASKSMEKDNLIETEKKELQNTNALILDGNLNSSKISKDHILNALTKQVAKKDIKEAVSQKNDLPIVNVEEERFPIPIALKMNNQTKVGNYSSLSNVDVNDDNEVLPARRDILQNHEREKRNIEIRKIDEVDIQNNDKEKTMLNNDHEICLKSNKSSLLITSKKNKEESPQTTVSDSEDKTGVDALIKTNVYLSQQDFTEKTVPVTSAKVRIDPEFTQLKKRDLKALTSDNYST